MLFMHAINSYVLSTKQLLSFVASQTGTVIVMVCGQPMPMLMLFYFKHIYKLH